MAEIELRLTREDLLAAALLHNRAALANRRTVTVVGFCAGLVAAVVYALSRPAPDAVRVSIAAAAGMAVYLYVIFLLVRWIRVPLAVRRQFREQKSAREPYVISWSDRSYAVRGLTIQTDTPWDHYLKWQEDGRVLLLYQTSALFQLIPKRVLTGAAIDEIRNRLDRSGVPKGRMFLG